MKALLYLGLSVALLYTLVFADSYKGPGRSRSHKDDHEKKGGRPHHEHHRRHHDHHHGRHHGRHHRHRHHYYLNETSACHKIAPGNAKFAFEFFKELAADHPSENIVFSPVSISTALALLSLGAKTNTHNQIIEGIGFNTSETPEKDIKEGFHHLQHMLNDDESELSLESGNGLFISKTWTILDQFIEEAKNVYDSETFSVDFQDNEEAKKLINTYVEEKTGGMIPEVLSSVAKNAALVLVNFIYFKGNWESPFEEKWTEEDDFHVSDTETVKVPFMWKSDSFKMANLKDATVVSLPYTGNASALFILPSEGKLQEVEANLKDIVKKFRKVNWNENVDIFIPKFSVAGSLDLKDTLSKLGITDVFTEEADLSGITGLPNLYISKAIHKAKITIDETGTEAAGSTVLEAMAMSLPPTVRFNRPFIFTIYSHSTRSFLFLAKIANPSI
ncbi:alpha-1-antiproteinase-like [Hyperolius riggenbachi]|uniref:alpha-1-antiproteinase-like n=1 Tax=Hyperolius riggenbachi TaxID=752182 RepID=UPI0035A3C3A6